MILRTGTASIDLAVMGQENHDRGTPVRLAVVLLTDGSWGLQPRGRGAPVRNFRGAFFPDTPAEAEWDRLMEALTMPMDLVSVRDGVETVIARGYVSGTPRLEDPDVRNGIPVFRRWRFAFTERPPSALPEPPADNLPPPDTGVGNVGDPFEEDAL